jgi:hypothetical protein
VLTHAREQRRVIAHTHMHRCMQCPCFRECAPKHARTQESCTCTVAQDRDTGMDAAYTAKITLGANATTGRRLAKYIGSHPSTQMYTLPPSLPHSPKRRELVKDARRQHADRVAGQVEGPGHETRRQSALTHSTSTCPLCPSACTCMWPMHMRHAHACVQRGSLSGYARTVHACAHVHVPLTHEYKIPM